MVRELRGTRRVHQGSDRPKSPAAHDPSHSDGPEGAISFTRHLRAAPDLIGRIAFLTAAAYAFSAGMRVYDGAGIWAPAIILGLALYAGAILSLLGAFWVRNPASSHAQAFLGSLVLLALVASVAYEISVANRSYGTDAIAFAHVGAEVLLNGDNPYAVNGEPLGPIIERFGVPETFVTRTTSGEPIERLISYPGGHVLAYTGALAFGVEDLRWATLAFEVAALGVIWWTLSAQARLLVPLVLLVEPNLTVYFTSGGVTDWLWVLPLAVTAVMLHQRRWGYAGLALGVACAIKQQPWFAVPFVIIWAFMHIRQTANGAMRRDLGALLGGIVTGFMVLNLPFLVWSPIDWISGVLSPISDRLVPDGQGLSVLASRGFAPTPQLAFSVAMFLVFAGLILFYYRRFERARNLLWVLPPALLLFSHRSLHNYFIFWIPVAALWLDSEMNPTTVNSISEATPAPEVPRRSARAAVTGAVLLAISGAVGVYLASDTAIQVDSVDAHVDGGIVAALDVVLTNTGSEPLEPIFEVYWGRYPVPWEAVDSVAIEPNESATVRIVPISRGVIPPLVVNEAGHAQPRPFRVRVNDKSESSYVSSDLIQLEPITDSIVNSEFRYWGSANGSSTSPFGWLSAEIELAGTSVQTRTLGSGRGASMTVAQVDQDAGGWGEAALVQDVVSVEACYRLLAAYDYDYAANIEGRPLAAAGLQVLQGDSAAWFVLSNVDQIRVTTLPEQTRIVEVPAAPGGIQDLTIEVADARSEIEVGEPGTIKLFSALHESQRGALEFRVDSLTDCA